MSLRISSGIYKNKRLKSIPGKQFRPLSERIKLSLFSILGSKIKGSYFLDFFAGTGNVGLEALSLGAKFVIFVEKEKDKINLIKHNVSLLGVEDKIKILHIDVFNCQIDEKFDIVFAGPPYKANFGTGILQYLRENNIAGENTTIILQHHYKEDIDIKGYKVIDKRRYGNTVLDFFVIS